MGEPTGAGGAAAEGPGDERATLWLLGMPAVLRSRRPSTGPGTRPPSGDWRSGSWSGNVLDLADLGEQLDTVLDSRRVAGRLDRAGDDGQCRPARRRPRLAGDHHPHLSLRRGDLPT